MGKAIAYAVGGKTENMENFLDKEGIHESVQEGTKQYKQEFLYVGLLIDDNTKKIFNNIEKYEKEYGITVL